MSEIIFVNCDGGSRGNPGPAAIGVVIRDIKRNKLEGYKEYIGNTTNNVAEYKALIKALELAAKYTTYVVYVYMDSELVIKQMKGEYKVKAKHLYPLYQEVKKLEQYFTRVVYNHVARSIKYQSEADRLVNDALDNI